MTALLLPLLAAVPVMAAALTAILPWRLPGRALALAVPAITAVTGLGLLAHHRSTPVEVAHVGGFVPGVAIPFVSDSFTAIMLVATGVVATLALLFADLTGEFARSRYFAPLALLLLAGSNGALLTGDLFNLFVFVEVMLLPSYALIAMTGGWRRLGIGRLFVVVNLLTSTLLLAGVGFVYATAGAVNIAALAGAATEDGRVAATLGVVIMALCIKAGAVPVHGWLPRSYPGTSAGVMALFSALHTKVALYAVIRIWATAFDLDPAWGRVLLVVALVTVMWGAIASVAPTLGREVLAWQMVSGVGVILAALTVAPPVGQAGGGAGPGGAIVYMVHHMVTIGALVMLLGAAEHVYGTGRLDRLSGLWHRERPLAVLLVIAIAALVGLPPTSGLTGKLEVLLASMATGGGWGVATIAVVLVGSLVGLVAMVRLWREAMWGAPMTRYRPLDVEGRRTGWTGLDDEVRVPARLLLPAGLLCALSVAMFLGYGAVAPEVDRAVAGLIDTSGYVDAVLGGGGAGGGEALTETTVGGAR
ncbi:proton-conducting transporter membrane subunit [Dietzia sp. 179-F 9C3 NHS]|uniref:proton-conducting transporter transmembrane domain-containing protein n=1 Tax=Dietzia sp. 179-F 9C3 NHS TaxID=3374295 RepID=UPI0038797DF8